MKKLLLAICFMFLALPVYAAFQEQPVYRYKYISTAATTVVKEAPAILHTISVQGGTPGSISVYNDGVQATAANLAFIIDSTSGPTTYVYDLDFASGCTVVTSQATKLVVSFK